MNTAVLDKMTDEELSLTIERAQQTLMERDRERKAEAMKQARTVLEKVGLSLKDLAAAGKKATAGKHARADGKVFRHPGNPNLEWGGRGNKPQWLRDLEATGGKPIEVAAP
jgi:DNA-binding protein H-NS